MKRSTIIALGVVALGLVAALFYILSSGDTGSGGLGDKVEKSTTAPTTGLETGTNGNLEVPPTEVLKHYREWAKYPPDSRPLKESHTDVMEPHIIRVPPQVMPVVKDGKLVKSNYGCTLQPLNHAVTEGEAAYIQFSCQRVADGKRVPVKIQKIDLKRWVAKKQIPTSGMEINDEGKNGDSAAGDNNYMLYFKPKRNDWGDMHLALKFRIPEEEGTPDHVLKTYFFSSPVAPAKFTGNIREKIADKSLVITVELNVRKPGRYTIEANLLADEGPVAFARKDARLKAGLQTVDLLYYGKIFHDRGHKSPYKLVSLRGIRDNDPVDPAKLTGPVDEVDRYIKSRRTTEPPKEVIPYWKKEYVTQQYSLDEFTTKEHDSAVKRERIADLERRISGK